MQNLTTLSIPCLQEDPQDGFYHMNLRLQIDLPRQDYSHRFGVPVQFGPSPMTREYSATPQLMFHQLNGEKSMVEGVMTDVNFLVQRPRQKNQMNYVHRSQYLN